MSEVLAHQTPPGSADARPEHGIGAGPSPAEAKTSHPPPVAPIVGIDLGTTNSLIAVAGWTGAGEAGAGAGAGGMPRCLTDSQGRAMMPSVVRFDGAGRVEAVGVDARDQSIEHADRTVSSVKRLMGRSMRDAAGDMAFLPFRVVGGAQDTARVSIPLEHGGSKIVSPQEVSAAILRALKQQGERALGVSISRAVVTVPAYFDDAQRQATRDAGRLAGLDVVRIVNEPTAAALAYGLGVREAAGASREPKTIAVYDLGGGTFDVSILRITPGENAGQAERVSEFFQVLSTAGDTRLGGDDMDSALVALFTREIAAARGEDAANALSAGDRQALRRAAEDAKIRLSDQDRAEVCVSLQATRGVEYVRTITRAEFEALIAPLVERTLESCRRAIRDAKVMTPGSSAAAAQRGDAGDVISAVVMVGGATRVPLVRRRVEEFFGITPYTAINPDEVVALGAAVQASVIERAGAGRGASSLLLDVLPLSLGLETVGGAMAKLIVRNSTVPARASETFSTSVDNQTGIKLNVLQGEREMAADCRLLGAFELKGIPPMPAGIPKLVVEFLVDASGVLTVRAVEQRSGKALQAQVAPNHGLTREEVERLERESLVHAREDMTRHRITDLIAHAKFDADLIEKQLNKHHAALDAPYAEQLRERLAALRSLIAAAQIDWRSVDANAFQKSKEELDRASIRLHEVSIARSLRE